MRYILVLLVAGLAVLLGYAATRPDTFEVRRSLLIPAPAEKIHPLISDMHQFNRWNPYARKDPQMSGQYRGPAAGVGAAYDFAGEKSGKGSLTITGVQAPGQVTMRLDMTAPFEAHNDITFDLHPVEGGTEVSWRMVGASPYLAKVAGLFFSMDRMIGTDFEAGLASLKAIAAQP